jgi:hypothetical protein
MDTTEFEAAYGALLEAAAIAGLGVPSEEAWDVDTVLAHIIASSRMLAAASAELLSGRTPVVDNRPTQSRAYFDAIARSAARRSELVGSVRRCGQELVILASQLSEEQTARRVPTIIVDAGRVRVERPVAFSSLLESGHIHEHLEQLREWLEGRMSQRAAARNEGNLCQLAARAIP